MIFEDPVAIIFGDLIQPSANAGECGKPDFSIKVTPKPNTGWEGAPEHAGSGIHQEYQGTGLCTVEREDDGIRRRWQMHKGVSLSAQLFWTDACQRDAQQLFRHA
jgi:hypothetical protein